MTGTIRTTGTLAAALITAVLLVSIPARAQAKIAVRDRVEVVNRVVLIGDVADITGVPQDEINFINSLKFTTAPVPNSDLTFNDDQVKGKLLNAGLDLDKYELDIPSRMTVHRKASIIPGKRLLDEGIKYLDSHMPWDNITVEQDDDRVPRDVVLEYGEVRLEYELHTTPKNYGIQTFSVDVYLNDEKVRVIGLTSYVKVMGEVITAAREIRAGDVITEEDLAYETQDVTRLRPGAYDSKDKLLGKQALRTIQKGDLFTHSAIETVPDISAGDIVTITVRRPGMEVSSQAKALQKGYIGETIKVVTSNPKRVLNGIVLDDGTVEIAGP